jgi:hypothetical protein
MDGCVDDASWVLEHPRTKLNAMYLKKNASQGTGPSQLVLKLMFTTFCLDEP